MHSVKILDCTLRDGGYINNWNFGAANIKSTVSELIDSGIDIVEVGYLTFGKETGDNETCFSSLDKISNILPVDKKTSKIVAMVNCGEIDVESLPDCRKTSLDGIRVVFHKNCADEAFLLCNEIKKKGYKVFVQPMATMRYSDLEFISLIEKANKLMPYAFYIVDSHGSMRKKDMIRYFNLADNNLSDKISLGFHSHNNLQLSYSNAQVFASMICDRKLIVDCSIFGMGRGAGNLNTELFIGHLNSVEGTEYKVEPILRAIDRTIEGIYKKTPWGYSLPYYMSATYKCHPNYAKYLSNKQTLTFKDMNTIFAQIDEVKKDEFDKKYIEHIYFDYLSKINAEQSIEEDFSYLFEGKKVVIIAPGQSLLKKTAVSDVKNKILAENAIAISVNHIPNQIECDYIFVSNVRRYEALENKNYDNMIITSNIHNSVQAKFIADYSELINTTDSVEDNATLMLLALLIKSGARSVWLAGVDGYLLGERNFVNESLETHDRKVDYALRNKGLEIMLNDYSKKIPIEFITETRLNCLN